MAAPALGGVDSGGAGATSAGGGGTDMGVVLDGADNTNNVRAGVGIPEVEGRGAGRVLVPQKAVTPVGI
jgi:hypothetical protein